MPPLLLSILIGIIGLGVPFDLLLRRVFPSLGEWGRLGTTVVSLCALITLTQWYVEYPNEPRHLAGWQRQALSENCQAFKALRLFVGSAPGALEAESYSRQLMSVLVKCGVSAAYGYDPAPHALVVNGDKTVVPPDIDSLLRARGVQIWIPDPKRKSKGVKKLERALRRAGILVVWARDIRLEGVAAEGGYRWRVTGPQCILFVGTKQPWGLGRWWFAERRHVAWVAAKIWKQF